MVADLFPTARGNRDPLDNKERAQDIGRKLMLEIGPLVGMIQIPGIKFGVKDVVTLATLNSSIEDVLESMFKVGINSLEEQTEFLGQCLDSWLEATGRKHDINNFEKLDPSNVVYQGRVLVSFLTLLPACIWIIKMSKAILISDEAKGILVKWLDKVMECAGLLENGKFIAKEKFKTSGYLGSGGIGRFRDTLWASVTGKQVVAKLTEAERGLLAEKNKMQVYAQLAKL